MCTTTKKIYYLELIKIDIVYTVCLKSFQLSFPSLGILPLMLKKLLFLLQTVQKLQEWKCATAVQCVLNALCFVPCRVFSRIAAAQQHGHDCRNSVRRPVSTRHHRSGGLHRHEGDAQPPRLRRVSASQSHRHDLPIATEKENQSTLNWMQHRKPIRHLYLFWN